MKLAVIVRSYAGRTLEFGPITISPWKFAEYPYADFKLLQPEVLQQLERAKVIREISIQLVADEKPVDEMNENTVIRMWDEAQGGQPT